MKKFTIALITGTALALAGCAEEADTVDETPVATDTTAVDTGPTIADLAGENPDFSTLATAVGAADLGETLSGPGPYTVFAPNNAAFDALPAGTLDTLTQPANKDQLSGILTYHVVQGETNAAALAQMIADNDGTAELTTVNGGTLSAMMDGDNVVLRDATGNTATVVATDVDASNGVIHVIDTVMMPE